MSIELILVLLAIATACLKSEFKPMNQIASFTLPKLPYKYSDLEPVLWSELVYFHYKKEHSKFVDQLNQVIEKNTPYNKYKLTDLLLNFGLEDDDLALSAGGHYSHALFWWSLKPSDCTNTEPKGKLSEDIAASFGSFDSFKTEFGKRAASLFGSGWVWLCRNSDGILSIIGKNDEYNPLAGNEAIPIIGIDVWEHAYYLYYLWDRVEWVKRWWELVDWDLVGFWYSTYVVNGLPIPV